jgi:hypothetical protein
LRSHQDNGADGTPDRGGLQRQAIILFFTSESESFVQKGLKKRGLANMVKISLEKEKEKE